MTIVSTILGVETGGRNITQGNIGDINNIRGTPAQGYFQITDATWAQFGGLNTGYTSAIQAPYSVQLQVAQNIPIGRWGPNTQAALQAQGYQYSRNQTLGDVMAANGETPNYSQYGSTSATGTPDGGQGANTGTQYVDPWNLDGSPSTSGTTTPGGSTSGTTTPGTSTSGTQTPGTNLTGTTTPGQGQGSPVNVGIQGTLVQDIQGWLTGAETKTGAAFKTATANVLGGAENWFTRGFLIIVGVVLVGAALFLMADGKLKQQITGLIPKAA